jgi:exonuclease III
LTPLGHQNCILHAKKINQPDKVKQMRYKILIFTILLVIIAITFSCGTNVKITDPNLTDTLGIAFGTEGTFDIITWNIENFPKHNPETTDLLTTILPGLRAECIAIQEVGSTGDFSRMMNNLPGWGYRLSSSGDTKTAIIYNSETVQIDSSATIFTGMSNPFPRAPLLLKLTWQGEQIILISMHLKAFGDNYIDETDEDDEEMRRRYACQLLDEYIDQYFPNDKVIVVGDTNDQIQEPAAYNVFNVFLTQPAAYRFADMSIAQNITQQNCSYPGYMSHIDHILITNELFTSLTNASNYVRTINVENYIAGGMISYDNFISDHRPVGARFRF